MNRHIDSESTYDALGTIIYGTPTQNLRFLDGCSLDRELNKGYGKKVDKYCYSPKSNRDTKKQTEKLEKRRQQRLESLQRKHRLDYFDDDAE